LLNPCCRYLPAIAPSQGTPGARCAGAKGKGKGKGNGKGKGKGKGKGAKLLARFVASLKKAFCFGGGADEPARRK
jgi:hypothetical protein